MARNTPLLEIFLDLGFFRNLFWNFFDFLTTFCGLPGNFPMFFLLSGIFWKFLNFSGVFVVFLLIFSRGFLGFFLSFLEFLRVFLEISGIFPDFLWHFSRS